MIIGEICRNICKDRSLVDDLIQEVALIWAELSCEKKDKVRKSGAFKWWVARTTKNLWSSSSSPFYSKYRKNKAHEWSEYHTQAEVEWDAEEDERYELLLSYIDVLFPSEYNILHSYYFQHLTIMQIVTKFDVDKNFVWNTIKRVERSLKRKMEWSMFGYKELELADMVSDYIGKSRLKVEERQIILDIYNLLFDNNFNNVYDKNRIFGFLDKIVSRLCL